MAIVLGSSAVQTAIGDSVGRLLADRYDFQARRAALTAGRGSPGFWGMLAELGLLGIEVDESQGGIGGSFAETAVVLQAFGRALVVEPFVPTAVLGAGLLMGLGSAVQIEGYLARMVAGTLKMALAHDEGETGPDDNTHPAAPGEAHLERGARGFTATATTSPRGWHLRGNKSAVLGGDVADLLIVSATTVDGLSLFLVPSDTPGMARNAYALYDEHGAADVSIDAVLPLDALLGSIGGGQPAIELALDRAAAAAIHESVGAMEQLCTMTPAYLKTRVQFGQPLARFQVLQHRMVDMGMALEQARSMALLSTAALAEQDPSARARDVSAAKVFVGGAARLIGQSAIQLHGAIALTDEYPVGHYVKRLTMLARQFGDELHHLDRYTALMS